MEPSQNAFTAQQYAPRAQAYVESEDHARGEDLDQVEALVRGRGLARVLDLGCGGGHVSYRAAPHVGEVVACDLTPAMLEAVAATALRRGLTNIVTAQGPAESLPFADAAFDAVLCRFTAHHWQDWEAGLREARRVAKPGALAVFIDVAAPAAKALDSHLQAVELLRDPSHVRDYAAAEWVAALARAGFDVEGLTARRLRMRFPVWTARAGTPPVHAAAIRSLQDGASSPVREHFRIADDGSFDLDTLTIVARGRAQIGG